MVVPASVLLASSALKRSIDVPLSHGLDLFFCSLGRQAALSRVHFEPVASACDVLSTGNEPTRFASAKTWTLRSAVPIGISKSAGKCHHHRIARNYRALLPLSHRPELFGPNCLLRRSRPLNSGIPRKTRGKLLQRSNDLSWHSTFVEPRVPLRMMS